MAIPKLMCVDDSPIMLAKLKQLAESVGYDVCGLAQSGSDAVKLYQQLEPDVVTMDITMVGQDGIETVRQIRVIDPDARIVMVTSHGQESMVLQALKAGAKGYVMKPVDPDSLSAHLARALK
jgi:two-component system chemotaxis response regulator CheY